MFKLKLVASVLSIVSMSAFADVFWTGASTESTKYWDDSSNWNGTSGNYVIRTYEMQNAPVEVNFRTAASITTGFWIENSLDGIVTFKAPSTDYGLTMSQTDMHVGGSGGLGALVIDGGKYHFANDLFLGYVGSTGRLTIKSGRVETSYWMPIGDGNGGTGSVLMEDGELIVGYRDGSTQTNGRLELCRGANSSATFTQLGGTVSAQGGNNAGDRAIAVAEGSNSTAVYTISNGTCVARGNYIGVGIGSGSTGTFNLHGGTVETIAFTSGSGTGSVNFDGGTLVTKLADQNIIPSGLSMSVGSSGGTISSAYDVSIGATISGSASGALVKTGSGTLTLSGAVASLVTVEEGSLVSPAGTSYTSGTFVLGSGTAALSGTPSDAPALVVEPNAVLTLGSGCIFGAVTMGAESKIVIEEDASQLGTDHAVLTFASLSLPDGATAADYFAVTANGKSVDFTVGETAVTVSAATTTWTDAAENDSHFNTAGNWSNGVPDATKAAVFDANAEVTLTGNEAHNVGNITLSNNAYVKFQAETVANYPSVCPGAVEGTGTIELYRCGLVATSAVTVPNTVAFRITNDGQQTANDSWLQGGSSAPLTINGTVTVVNYLCLYEYVSLNGRVELLDGSCLALDAFNTSRSSTSTISEIYVAEGNTALCNHSGLGSDVVKTGAGTLQANQTGYDELVMKEGIASLASNEGPSIYFTFQGGTLQIAYAMTWFDELANRINNSPDQTDAIKIDTQVDVAFSTTALGGAATTNGLVKLGSSTLTLGVQPTYTGDTTVSAGTLKVPAGTALPGALTIADGAKIVVVVDPNVWLAGYKGTLFSYGSLASGQTLTTDNIEAEGLYGSSGIELDITESGVVKATVTGEQYIWNGGSADWLGEGVWKNSSTSEATTWVAESDAVFSGADMDDSVLATNTVAVGSDVVVGNMYSTSGEGRAYRFTGEGITAAALNQAGAGAVIFANKSVAITGATTISAGEVVLEGATFSADSDIANTGVIRASGNAVSTLARYASGSGTYVIDEGATLALSVPQIIPMHVTGYGTLKPCGGWFTVQDLTSFDNFDGTIRLETGNTLYIEGGVHKTYDNGALGNRSMLVMAGGTIARFGLNKSGTNDEWLDGDLVFEDGTHSYINNYECRSGWAGARVHLACDISGSGEVTFGATAHNDWHTSFEGDNSEFSGVMNLNGTHFDFYNETAGCSNGVVNFVSANQLDLRNASNTTLYLGALNVTELNASVYVLNAGSIVEIGAKADSLVNGAFTGSEFTLKKVGNTSLVIQGGASAANVTVAEGGFGGTTTIKSLTLADGAEIAFADLSDTSLTYEGPTVLSEPQWTKLPNVWNGITDRGRWILNMTTEEVTPTEGDAYTVWKLSATFRKGAFIMTLR